MRQSYAGSLLLVLVIIYLTFATAFPTNVDATQNYGSPNPQSSTSRNPNTYANTFSNTTPPTRASPPFSLKNLGSGWKFQFIGLPQTFIPIQPAAERLEFLYQLVEQTTIQAAPSASGVFRVGDIALIVHGPQDTSAEDLQKGLGITWPIVAAFCRAMRSEVQRGLVVKYEGVLTSGNGRDMTVQLSSLSELMKQYQP